MKVAVFGNCQVVGLASCLNALAPDLEAESFLALHARSPDAAKDFAAQMAGYDVVFTQRLSETRYSSMGTSALRAAARRLIVIPQIVFTGFHPDTVIPQNGSAGRFGNYHSAIVAGAHSSAVPRRRVAELFNAYVFARLGYREEYAKSKTFLLANMAKADVDGPSLLARWERLGQFMYTPNHPAIGVLRELAIDLCGCIGVKPDLASAPPEDELAKNVRLPVYPEIARLLGVPGSRQFALLSGDILSVEEMVAELYHSYDMRPPDLESDPRIAAAADLFRAELDCIAA